MIWLALWVVGLPIAYCLDSDPTGTRRDRLIGAAMWPLVVLIIGALIAVGATMLMLNVLKPKAR